MSLQTADLNSYDRIIHLMSGGKDSLAGLLDLFERGVSADKIELHHHLVDGGEGSDLLDWPVTASYCRAIAQTFGLAYSESWKVGGLEGEILRDNQPTAPISIPHSRGRIQIGGKGPLDTRRKFPQLSPDLRVRYCSAYGKVDCLARWICNDDAFNHRRTLVISGERAQESSNRAGYAAFEPHRTDRRNSVKLGRHVDHYRSVHQWTEEMVWEIIERWGVVPHPAYYLGTGRVSCQFCIYSSPNQWATNRKIAPCRFNKIAGMEREFGITIHRKKSVIELADAGTPYEMEPLWLDLALSPNFYIPIITSNWKLPKGAYGESCGPT